MEKNKCSFDLNNILKILQKENEILKNLNKNLNELVRNKLKSEFKSPSPSAGVVTDTSSPIDLLMSILGLQRERIILLEEGNIIIYN
jgi:hypothetical protein